MSSNKQNSANNASNDSPQGWESISNSSITKPFGGMHNFMNSYGLKPTNTDNYDQAHEIINEMKKADWKESQEQKNNK